MNTTGPNADTGAPNRARSDALIGYTGFVGSTLARQARFGARFNRANMHESAGAPFATAVCAAAPGSMFEANTAPDQDRAAIHALIDQLSRIKADRFVLISSIAVLSDFAGGVDENFGRCMRAQKRGTSFLHLAATEICCCSLCGL